MKNLTNNEFRAVTEVLAKHAVGKLGISASELTNEIVEAINNAEPIIATLESTDNSNKTLVVNSLMEANFPNVSHITFSERIGEMETSTTISFKA